MATFKIIPDEVLEPNKPIRSVDGFALRDNPIAIAQGAPGAPRVQTAALEHQAVQTDKVADRNITAIKLAEGAAEAAWVAGRLAVAGLGAKGMHALAKAVSGPTGGPPGTIREGSRLRYVSIGTSLNSEGNYEIGYAGLDTSTPLEGSWMCLSANAWTISLWIRVQ